MKREKDGGNKKRKRAPVFKIAFALAAALASTAVFALFNAAPAGADNKLTLGNVSVTVEEGGNWNADGAPAIAEGVSVAKAPKVKNDGALPVYTRLLAAGGTDKFLFSTKENPGSDTGEWVEFESLHGGEGAAWELKDDGFWYYIEDGGILAADGVTPPLFTYVKLKGSFAGGADELDLIVYAEAVQTISYETGEAFTGAAAAFEALKGGDIQ
ncbi:MAG: hypothetical protein LBD49_00775 [Oscillospiraceae bacterium]|jgi:hypothetical protein|nr:hypothetical protein [Oscillospiraceae bacterium]